MHELSLISGLLHRIESIVAAEHATKVVCVRVTLGALSHISAGHFREHFVHAARGTIAQDARLDVHVLSDTSDPRAQEIVLESIEVEE